MKAHATYRMRQAVDDTMDIHGGKTIIDGPKNYFGNVYRSVPVGITVEGANIVTRSLIIFGQGAMRDHPYLLKEVVALEQGGKDGLEAFDEVVWKHAGHIIRNLGQQLRQWLDRRQACRWRRRGQGEGLLQAAVPLCLGAGDLR